jgi:hypothetical protein
MDHIEATTARSSSDMETEIKEIMGLFDVPSFARRGKEMEFAVRRLNDRCRRSRSGLLEMVRIRLRQWSAAVTGPGAWSAVFSATIEPLWPLSDADEPVWAAAPAPARRQRAIARDLIAATRRFNGRWVQFLDRLYLDPTNDMIDQYNRYYLFEKECVMGSARLAARIFTPAPRLTKDALLRDHPVLPIPELLG